VLIEGKADINAASQVFQRARMTCGQARTQSFCKRQDKGG
jgi:hypothetical protein